MTDTPAEQPHRKGVWNTLRRVALLRWFLVSFLLMLGLAGAQIATLFAAKALPAYAQAITLGGAFIGAVFMIGLYLLVVLVFERRRAGEIAFRPGQALAGALFGLALFCAVYAIFWMLGLTRFEGFGGFAGFAPALGMAAASAVGEEIVFRGGVFRILEDSFGTLVALLISSALFGLLHAGNKGATTVSTVAIALEAGLLLGLAYAATRNLWLAIGLHFGWNFTEGGVFGAAVSGNLQHGLIKAPITGGSDLMTGGAFGPEASVIAIAVCMTGALLLLAVTLKTRRWKPLAFRMMLD